MKTHLIRVLLVTLALSFGAATTASAQYWGDRPADEQQWWNPFDWGTNWDYNQDWNDSEWYDDSAVGVSGDYSDYDYGYGSDDDYFYDSEDDVFNDWGTDWHDDFDYGF